MLEVSVICLATLAVESRRLAAEEFLVDGFGLTGNGIPAEPKCRLHTALLAHPACVFEVAEDSIDRIRDGVVDRMCAAAALDVDLKVDVGVGNNWDEAH